MAIFGSLYPKFIYDSTEVDLQNSLLDPVFLNSDEIVHVSGLNGKKNYLNLFDNSKFTVTVNLFKYDNPTDKLLELYEYLNKSVTFYPFADGNPIKDIAGNVVLFTITNISPYFLFNTGEYDVVLIEFESNGYIYLGTVPLSFGYGYNYGMYYGYGL